MFYNEEVKEKFLKDYLRSRVVSETSVRALLRKASIKEIELDKDCCNFSKEEIIDMYKSFDAKSVNVLENYNVYLKGYAAFCVYNKICSENNYNQITKEILNSCISKETLKNLIITREQLDDIEDMLYNYTDKAILECLWYGISGKGMDDLVSITRADISQGRDKVLTLKSGRSIKLSKKLYNYLDNAFDETQYMCYGKRIIIQELIGNDSLYKEMKNSYAGDSEDKFFRWVYRKIMTFRKFVDIPALTMKNIQASGLLHFIKEGMSRTGLDLIGYLRTEEGRELGRQYGYTQKYYVGVITDKYEMYFK